MSITNTKLHRLAETFAGDNAKRYFSNTRQARAIELSLELGSIITLK